MITKRYFLQIFDFVELSFDPSIDFLEVCVDGMVADSDSLKDLQKVSKDLQDFIAIVESNIEKSGDS